MDDTLISPLISYMQSLSGESLSMLLFAVSAIIMLLMFRAFGLMGLYVYSAISTVMANVQVLKLGSFEFLSEPVALGTVTFATVFLSSDIITEHFGKQAAQRNIWLSFVAQVLVTIVMIMTIGFAPTAEDASHSAMIALFLPTPRLLIASLSAFIISQFAEVSLFQWMSSFCGGKKLWLRANISLMVSGFVDNIIFGVLAWVVLSPTPVSTSTLIYTYLLGTYLFRVVLALFSTPVIYLSYYFKPEEK